MRFLDTARRVADYYIGHLPADHVPYWDFEAPGIPTSRVTARGRDRRGRPPGAGRLETDPTGRGPRSAARDIAGTSPSSRRVSGRGRGQRGDPAPRHPNRPDGSYDRVLIYADFFFMETLLAPRRSLAGSPTGPPGADRRRDGRFGRLVRSRGSTATSLLAGLGAGDRRVAVSAPRDPGAAGPSAPPGSGAAPDARHSTRACP